LPATQSYRPGSFDSAAAVMLGYAASGQLNFRTAVAYLKIKIAGGSDSDDIVSVRVRANEDLETTVGDYGRQAMSGEFTATFADGACTLAPVVNAMQSVTLDCGAGVAQGTDLLIAIPAQVYTKGINLFIVDASGDCQTIISKKAFSADPGTIYSTEIQYNGGSAYQGAGIYTVLDWEALIVQETLLGPCSEFSDAEGVINLYSDLSAEMLQRHGGIDGAVSQTFAGTIEGNGHTVNVNRNVVPLFTYVSGTLRNITFSGNKSAFGTTAGWGTAQIALNLKNGAVMENVTADYNVTAVPTSTSTNSFFYGMVRDIEAGASMTNCTQKSNFTIDYSGVTTKDLYVLPFAQNNSGLIRNCRNVGNVSFLKDPGQKAVVAPIYTNNAEIDNFVNTGNFSVVSSLGAAVAGVVIQGGGYIHDCVNGVDGDAEKGKIELEATPTADGKTYHAAGIAVYGETGNAKNNGRFYNDINYGPVSFHKNATRNIYRSAFAGIVSDIRYGKYSGTELQNFNNTFTVIHGCVNKGYIKVHEEETNTDTSGNVPVFLGGILGLSLNNAGTKSGALILTTATGSLNGNYIVIRDSCANYGTLELATADGQPYTTSASGARLSYVGGIAGFTYGYGTVNADTDPRHYAVVRGKQNGTIKVGSSVTGSIAAGGIVGGCCYTQVDHASSTVTYEKTDLLTRGAAAQYRGCLGAVIGFVVKYSDVAQATPGNLIDNTGLPVSPEITEGAVGFLGITGATSVHNTSSKVTHESLIKTGSSYNGTAITADNLAEFTYGAGKKRVN
ncbi:MAG: hypothetical protein SOZ66_07525, partial [Candidatus Cryptobacteroides sp.]|nr:hypothetical protein [Candidatus Cryptobacteroides sp.]